MDKNKKSITHMIHEKPFALRESINQSQQKESKATKNYIPCPWKENNRP
jgi:hypothetical protein